MSEYIPYSKRHDIDEGTELAWFLDYCERIMGWDIKACWWFDDIDYTYELGNATMHKWYDWEIQFLYYDLELRIPEALFFRMYKTLIPEIRNLYSK